MGIFLTPGPCLGRNGSLIWELPSSFSFSSPPYPGSVCLVVRCRPWIGPFVPICLWLFPPSYCAAANLTHQQTAKQDGLPHANYFCHTGCWFQTTFNVHRKLYQPFKGAFRMRASIAPNILSVKIPILPPAKLCESVSQDTESWTPSHSHLFNYVYVDQSLPHALFLPRIIFFHHFILRLYGKRRRCALWKSIFILSPFLPN